MNREYMAYEDIEDLDPSDYSTDYEDNNSGGKVEVTRYADGSSTYHFGGPCGPQSYDEYGEEI